MSMSGSSYGHLSRRVQLAALAMLAALIFAASAAARTLHVVALGDSLTAGFGLPPGQGFPEVLQKALRAKGYDV